MSLSPRSGSTPDVGVLIVSWDGYADLWGPLFHFFFRHWSDCPFPVYLGTNSRTFHDPRVRPVLIGEEVDYCSNLSAMLRQLPHRWVIPWVEDFIPCARVDSKRIRTIIDHAAMNGIDYANLVALPHEVAPMFAGPAVVDTLGEMPADAPYRASMGVGLWRREALRRLLVPGETAWDLERIGSRRSAELGFRCLCTTVSKSHDPPVKVVNGIERGRWTQRAADLLRAEGMGNILEARGVETGQGRSSMRFYSLARYYAVRLLCAVGGVTGRRAIGNIVERRLFARLN